MLPSRVTSEDLTTWRRQLYSGAQFDSVTARRLIDELERLQEEQRTARVTFARKASEALRKRLTNVATFNHGGCPVCHDAEARAFLANLEKIVRDGQPQAP